VAFPSKRLRDHLTNRKRKKAVYNRDTHRVNVDIDIHACNTCGAWESKSEVCREVNETAIPHEAWCKFYPSLFNIEIEHRLEEEGKWYGSKWSPGYPAYDEAVERTKKAVKDSKERAKAFWASFGAKK